MSKFGELYVHYGCKDGIDIVFLTRKGINGDFADKKLAALPVEKLRNYSYTPGESATTLITNYIKEQLKSGHADEAKLKELAKGIVAWKQFEL